MRLLICESSFSFIDTCLSGEPNCPGLSPSTLQYTWHYLAPPDSLHTQSIHFCLSPLMLPINKFFFACGQNTTNRIDCKFEVGLTMIGLRNMSFAVQSKAFIKHIDRLGLLPGRLREALSFSGAFRMKSRWPASIFVRKNTVTLGTVAKFQVWFQNRRSKERRMKQLRYGGYRPARRSRGSTRDDLCVTQGDLYSHGTYHSRERFKNCKVRPNECLTRQTLQLL